MSAAPDADVDERALPNLADDPIVLAKVADAFRLIMARQRAAELRAAAQPDPGGDRG